MQPDNNTPSTTGSTPGTPGRKPAGGRGKLAALAVAGLLLLGGSVATVGGGAYWWMSRHTATATASATETAAPGQAYANDSNRGIMSVDVTRTYRNQGTVEVYYTVYRHDGYADDCREILYPQYPVDNLPPNEEFTDNQQTVWENTEGLQIVSIDVNRAQLDPQHNSKTVYLTITTTDGRKFEIAEPLTRVGGQQ